MIDTDSRIRLPMSWQAVVAHKTLMFVENWVKSQWWNLAKNFIYDKWIQETNDKV